MLFEPGWENLSPALHIISLSGSIPISRRFRLPMDQAPLDPLLHGASFRNDRGTHTYYSDKTFDIFYLEFYLPPSTEENESEDEEEEEIACRVFLSKDRLIKILKQSNGMRFDIDGIEWQHWGPTSSRWIMGDELYGVGVDSIYGSRFSCCLESQTETPFLSLPETENETLVLFDFNPRPIRRGATNYETNHSYCRVVTEAWAFSHPFLNCDVESSLPFRAFISKAKYDFVEVLLDGDRILGQAVRFIDAAYLCPTNLTKGN